MYDMQISMKLIQVLNHANLTLHIENFSLCSESTVTLKHFQMMKPHDLNILSKANMCEPFLCYGLVEMGPKSMDVYN